MAIRAGWLPTGTQSAEDTRAATGMWATQSGLLVPASAALPTVSTAAAPFALTATGSLSCSIGPGQANIAPGQTTTQGAYPVTVDASGGGLPTVSFAAGGTLARTDVIYLRIEDNAEDASGSTQPIAAVQQGNNGGGVPAVPAGALALWQVPVPAGASSINFGTAVYVGGVTVALGGVYPAASALLPAQAHKGAVRARQDRAGTAVPGPLEVWDGTTWNPAVPASMPRGIMAAPVSATAVGSPSVGTADTIDSVLPPYVFTATAGRRYRVVLYGLIGNGILLDNYALRVRDSGSASLPTTASPAVIDMEWECAAGSGSQGRLPIHMEGSFLATAGGTHTLAFFSQRTTGTGAFTPECPASNNGTGPRALYVEDIGNV